jgi:hypothetical protein
MFAVGKKLTKTHVVTPKYYKFMSWKSIVVSTEKKFISGKRAQKDEGNFERYVSERTEKDTDAKSGQVAGTTHES